MSREALLAGVVLALAVVVVVVARRRSARSGGTRTERESREFALHATPEQLGISVPETGDGIWGIIADLGLPGTTATVVAFADGYAGMYWGNDGGVFGGQTRQNVRTAARAAISAMEGKASLFRSTAVHDLPGQGGVRFYVRRREDLLGSEELQLKDLLSGGHPLSAVYALLNQVMTELRRATGAGA